MISLALDPGSLRGGGVGGGVGGEVGCLVVVEALTVGAPANNPPPDRNESFGAEEEEVRFTAEMEDSAEIVRSPLSLSSAYSSHLDMDNTVLPGRTAGGRRYKVAIKFEFNSR